MVEANDHGSTLPAIDQDQQAVPREDSLVFGDMEQYRIKVRMIKLSAGLSGADPDRVSQATLAASAATRGLGIRGHPAHFLPEFINTLIYQKISFL